MTNNSFVRLSPVCVMIALAATTLTAQSMHVTQYSAWPNPAVMHTGSQGYLGVDLADVDQDRQQQLHLKDSRGAVITLIDHDAPAGKVGLHVNDVIIQVNDQSVEGSEQTRRMLHEIAPGQKVQLTVCRDGKVLHFEAELADRRIIAHNMQQQIQTQGLSIISSSGMGVIDATSGAEPVTSGKPFHWWTGGASLNIGATVELLTPQMANYFGLENGLYVRTVVSKSEAEYAGLKPHDVILKVGSDAMTTIADWERTLNANDGKNIQITIQREKRQVTVTLQVDSKKHKG